MNASEIAKAERQLFLAMDAADGPAMDAALASGADIDCEDPECGMTPLMMAAMNGDEKSLALLLERGADPSASVRESDFLHMQGHYAGLEHTALWFAVKDGRKGCVKLLMDADGLPTPWRMASCAKVANPKMAAWFVEYVKYGWEREALAASAGEQRDPSPRLRL